MFEKIRNRIKHNKWLFLLALIVVVIISRLPSFELPFDMNSGANAYHARLIYEGEPLYSSHHPAHHLPGVYYVYALAFLLFGDNTLSVKLLLIPWIFATAFLIYLIGKRLDNYVSGMLAAFIYVLFVGHRFVALNSAESEIFANLPIVAAIQLTIELSVRRKRNMFFIFVGLLCSLGFLFKTVFLFPLVVTMVMIFFYSWFSPEGRNNLMEVVQRSIWLSLGFLIPVLILISYYAWSGLLSRFLLVFFLGSKYVVQLSQDSHPLNVIILPLAILIFNNIILVILSLGGTLHLIFKPWEKNRLSRSSTFIGFGIVAWFILSILIAGITRTGWIHYQIIVIPPLSLLAGWEIYLIYKVILNKRIKRIAILLISTIISAILIMSLISNFQQYYHYISYKIQNESYEEYLIEGNNPDSNQSFNTVRISNYIRSNTEKKDLIYTWSDYAQIYYMADRLAPVDIIWPVYAETTGSYDRIFSPETKYIIVGESILVSQPNWLHEELKKSYYLETSIGNFDLYRRKD